MSNLLTRRRFLHASLCTTAGAVAGSALGLKMGPDAFLSPAPSFDRRASRVLADLHVHPMLNDWNALSPLAVRNPLLAGVIKKAVNVTNLSFKGSYEAGIDLLCVAHFNMFDEWVTMPTDPNPDAPAHTLRMLDQLEERLQDPEVQACAQLVRSPEELESLTDITRKGTKDYRIAVMHTIEGGHALGGNLDALSDFARRGVAMMTVTHFFNKGIGSSGNAYPFFPDANSRWPNQGLSEFGKNVLAKMNELGMVIDISHCTSTTLHDVLREVSCPVVASHSSARTLGDHPYSLYDEHMKEISNRGGLIGVIVMPFWLSNFTTDYAAIEKGTLRDVVRTVCYVAKICGVDHVAIGTDFSGFITGPKDMTDLGQIDKLRSLLLEEFDQLDTERIMAQNVIDYFVDNWRRRQQ